MLLRGKCRNCKAPISPRYFIVELLTGLLFLLSVRTFGLNLASLKYSIFSFLILGLIFTDVDLRLLPDALTLPGIAIGIVFSVFYPVDGFSYFLLGPRLLFNNEGWRILSLVDSVIGAALAAFFIWAVGAAYKAVRHVEGMGFGDVKLMAMVGAFLGIKLAVLTIMAGSLMGSLAGVAAFIGVLIKRRRRNRRNLSPAIARERALQSARLILRHYEMPFGVFLGIAALGSAFFGQGLVHWYGSFFR
jgi:leader peptidase (prepilin peptidase)/N-methyltransferase